MPTWAQLVFGMFFFLASVVLVIISAVDVGPLAIVIFVGLILIAIYIDRKWRWRGFALGIILGILGSILLWGIGAVIVFR